MPPKRRNAHLRDARPHPKAQRMRKSQSKDAERKHKERVRRRMAKNLEAMEALSEGLTNNKGKSHTFGENKLLIFAIINELKRAMSGGNSTINTIPNWT